ncbi:MAG: dihydroxy-acid dehydratase, partial [Desulfobacterales bacterium]|nr:dihydroxy-acid dehydratase [Desulfobacterales bacterium]
FIHRSWMKNRGHPDDEFDGRPVIGICNTFSDLNPCHIHFRELADWIKRGVYEAGGFPLEFPVCSLSESQLRPTAMLFRNLVSMDIEEMIRGNPIDGVVLMVGCDKSTPAALMGASSCDIPAIALSGGPMLNGKFKGQDIGSGTDVWRLSENVRAGTISMEEFMEAERGMSRSAGSCMTMGTASTMASLCEALGVGVPHNAATPAVDAGRTHIAQQVGRRIVSMVEEEVKLSRILTKAAFENAIYANAAIGGSTNAVIHLQAIAGRLGVELSLNDWNRLGKEVPTIVDLMPSGKFLMEDLHYAGGIPAVLKILGQQGFLNKDALTVTGKTIWENVKSSQVYNPEVIRPFEKPLTASGGIAALFGNLAPNGAVLKPSAASPDLMKHRGRAIVFSSIEDFHARIDDPGLDVDASSILVLQNCGPKGYPGMAEVGNMGLPEKMLKTGVTDMVRLSDARMSGTAYGTVVLHISPEAAAGGPLALVKDGDFIDLDIEAHRLHLEVSEDELARRQLEWSPPEHDMKGGYQQLYVEHVLQADQGADLDYLVGCRGAKIPRPSH